VMLSGAVMGGFYVAVSGGTRRAPRLASGVGSSAPPLSTPFDLTCGPRNRRMKSRDLARKFA
jgi:hypothetical protein